MKRREFVQAVAASAALSATGVARAQNVVWKASDVHPLGYPTVEAISGWARSWRRRPTAASPSRCTR